MPLACLARFATAAAGVGCGDDAGNGPSASELKQRLVPPEQVRLESESEFEWDNPTDFVVQGLLLAESTAPSQVIGATDDAGFVAAAGEILKDKSGDVFVHVDAAAFDSEEGATTARDALHVEDLKQPCAGACVVSPTEYTVEGVPNAVAVHHVPNEGKPPPGLFPFEGYLAEFTIDSDLYVVQASGPPGLPEARFNRGVKAVYQYAAAHD